ncbi:hypothetical protein [Roseomonas rosulenta]|uniref:hypothetical protein n=1 Tax=Roseomonas rosulenta TaxID=2748667 RepID=UPI0018DFA433|nr:hypothetical protein [Roseomonas rosulenta]
MTKKQTSESVFARMWRARPIPFATGAAFMLVLIATGLWKAVVWFDTSNPGTLPRIVGRIIEAPPASASEASQLPGDWYISVFYKNAEDGIPIETWRLNARGMLTLAGDIEDRRTGHRGVASGYVRDNTISLAYGSADERRPGYGSFILRRVPAAVRGEGDIWVGTAIVHDCQAVTREGDRAICASGRILACPAILSQRPVPSAAEQRAYFRSECLPVSQARELASTSS